MRKCVERVDTTGKLLSSDVVVASPDQLLPNSVPL
jgi:hypothetical protein